MRALRPVTLLLLAVMIVPALATPVHARGRKWEKITPEERKLTSLEAWPDAPAVLLLRRTALVIDPKGIGSHHEEYRRIKILKEEGKSFATVSIPSSEYDRMKNLDARLITSEGKEIELDKDAVFEKSYSTYYRTQMTTVALAGADVGSIFEYRYDIYFDNYRRAWEFIFQDRLPVVVSEVSLTQPTSFEFKVSYNDPRGSEAVYDIQDHSDGSRTITYTMENLPPIPDEPLRLPMEELSARVAFSPSKIRYTRGWEEFQTSWKTLAEGALQGGYGESRDKSKEAGTAAREMTAQAASDREKAEILYRFVRDQIDFPESWSGELWTVDRIYRERAGDQTEQALLLQAMLAGAGLKASVVWSSPRNEGRLDQAFAQTSRINRVLVAVELDGSKVYLQPADRDLAFGHIEPELENVPCLLVDWNAAWVYLPLSYPEDSTREARLELDVDESGAVSGHGALTLTGHRAYQVLNVETTPEKTAEAWQTWLRDEMPGFQVDVPTVEESVDDTLVKVSWSMRQREEDVLGDEVSLPLSAPLALDENPFSLPVEQRYSPVHFPFRSVDLVETRVTWPEDWEMELKPAAGGLGGRGGSLKIEVEPLADGRGVVVTRRLEISDRDFENDEIYKELQEIYRRTLDHDARPLALVRR